MCACMCGGMMSLHQAAILSSLMCPPGTALCLTPCMQFEYRTMAAFVLACIVDCNNRGQMVCLQSNLISICLEQLDEPNPLLRQW